MMFSNDGFLNEKPISEGSSQTHVFTKFPDSAIDLDEGANDRNHDDTSENTSSNNQSSEQPFSQPLLVTNDVQYSIWQIEYYQKYFQVDTRQILERLLCSIVPRPNKSFLHSVIKDSPDLYGPVWVCITFIIMAGISGNIVTYFHVPESDFQVDFSKITMSATIVCLYWWLMPTSLYFYLRWHLNNNECTFLDLICVYGYSFSIFIPVSLFWLIPLTWLQWLTTVLSSLISGSILVRSLWPMVSAKRRNLSILSMVAILLMHTLISIVIMLVFFHVSNSGSDATTESLVLTTMTSSTTSKL